MTRHRAEEAADAHGVGAGEPGPVEPGPVEPGPIEPGPIEPGPIGAGPIGARVHPTLDDPVVESLSEAVGGPVGTRAGRHPWWTPVRVVLALTALTFALGMVQKQPCATTNWQDGQLRYAAMCYSDLPYLYSLRGFAELEWPYSSDEQVRARYQTMEYPVGISYWAYGTAWVTHVLAGSPDVAERYSVPVDDLGARDDVLRERRIFVAVNAVGLGLMALLAAWFLVGVNPRRPWDAAAFALSPALLLSGLVNWDLLAVMMTAGALWAWARGRPALTGVMVGLGAATKLYPLFLLGGLLVICWRERRWRELGVATAAAGAAYVVANAPAWVTGWHQWTYFWSFNSDRGADLGSVWLVVSQATGWVPAPDTINLVSWAFFVLWCLGVLVLGLAAPSTPRLAQLGFLVVAGFLLVNKVYSPQYVLWLLPLAVLARPRWRDLLVWQAGEVFYYAMVWFYLGEYLAPAGGGPAGAYWIAIAVRVLAELYLVAVVVRDILRPWHDPVDRPDDDLDDPWSEAGSDDLDRVERGGGEPDPDLELVADRGRSG
ncbi:glycosyltransferase 87 family protein [Nocardioides sp.]|uniref:glycosyltransferase family 87 protein n=1 Tax=Nocardioides sp. TaxID=35761 RepID=UPI003528EE79